MGIVITVPKSLFTQDFLQNLKVSEHRTSFSEHPSASHGINDCPVCVHRNPSGACSSHRTWFEQSLHHNSVQVLI
jgi:hypothetical protein